jgi:hypothetical protein
MGTDTVANWRHAAAYVDRILKGANPANTPVEQLHRFQLIINLKTAKALTPQVFQIGDDKDALAHGARFRNSARQARLKRQSISKSSRSAIAPPSPGG